MTTYPNQEFKPLVGLPTPDLDAPMPNAPAPVGEGEQAYPYQILSMWEKLYFSFPSPGLKKRVEEVRAWAEESER